MADWLDVLAGKLPAWPSVTEQRLRRDLRLHRALRLSEREELKRHIEWKPDRTYVVDPLAERIPGTWADMIYGEEPDFTAANDSDQDALDALIAENSLPDALQEAVKIASAEREVWWRVLADRTCPYPQIEWRSRLDVFPLVAGRNILAAAFIERLDPPPSESDDNSVWRYVELQGSGTTRNLLFRGDLERLGDEKPLDQHPETADLDEDWTHGLDMLLCGRVLNGRGRRPTVGRSDYAGIQDLLLALNEAATIGTENARLTGKKRVAVTPDMLDADGNFPDDTDVFVRNETDRDPDRPTDPLIQIEWQFDAVALTSWAEYLTDTALTRARVAPQLVGRNTENAQTGPALRARLLDSVLAANGKARAWDEELPKVLVAAQLIDSMPTQNGGFGHHWSQASEPPAIGRKSILPEDPDDEAQRHAMLTGAELESRETAIRKLNPDYSDDQVAEELQRIADEAPAPPQPFQP